MLKVGQTREHGRSQPTINVLRNLATLDWQRIVKVEHYRLKVDSVQHPVELHEERADYDARHGA